MCYAGGIREFVTYINRNKTPIHDGVIYMAGSKEDAMAEVSLQYNDSYSEIIVSFANNVHTPEGGMHEEGFKRALTNALNAYGRRMKILKDDEKVTGEDCREGLTCVISVKLTEAQFEGQTKAKLGNSEIRTLVNAIVSEKLEEFLEENPAVGRAILEKALTASRAREAARRPGNPSGGKPGWSPARCPTSSGTATRRDPALTEIYIVEGDSAGGLGHPGAGLPVPGHPPPMGQDAQRGEGPGRPGLRQRQAQPRDHRPGGGHRGGVQPRQAPLPQDHHHGRRRRGRGPHPHPLPLTFFFRFMRPLVEQGYVYSAVPPLYKLTRGKQQRVAYSDEERDQVSAQMRGTIPTPRWRSAASRAWARWTPTNCGETTMNPETRTLRRITLEDAVKADEIFTILMGKRWSPGRSSSSKTPNTW